MKLLAVDTALGACSAALIDDERVLAHRFVAMERGHAEALAPMVEAVMAGHAFNVLERLAVTTGPGTLFTINSRSGLTSPEVACRSCEANPAFPEAKM